jgi:hypothetical protein
MKYFLILMLISGGLQAQKRDNFWLKQGIGAAAMLTSGFLQGANEVAVNDYRRFAARHPNANPKWSNPKISQFNKFKSRTDKTPKFFGSTTVFVFVTDRHHAFNTTRNFLVAGNIGVTMSLYHKPNWKQIVVQAAASWAFFAVGSGAAHHYYKPIN